MLAVDTNVVVRYLTGDNPKQARVAERLVRESEIRLLSTVVLETEWVLRSLYGYSREHVHAGLSAFAGLASVTVDDPERIARALDWFGQGMDFADAMHLAGCGDGEAFATFDRKLKTAAGKAKAGVVECLRK